jgi:hypothetical protein
LSNIPTTTDSLLALLQSTTPVERDRFVAHLYQARREYRRMCETAGKSGKRVERCVISSFQIAESMGFRATFVNRSTYCELAIENLRLLHSERRQENRTVKSSS